MTAFSHITFFYSLRGANHQIMDKKETGFAEYKFSHKFSHKINKTIPKQETEFGKKKYEKLAVTYIVVYSRYGTRKVEIIKP